MNTTQMDDNQSSNINLFGNVFVNFKQSRKQMESIIEKESKWVRRITTCHNTGTEYKLVNGWKLFLESDAIDKAKITKIYAINQNHKMLYLKKDES